MIYLLYREYNPESAASIRALAYFRGMSELGVRATVVYFFPDDRRSKVQTQFEGISIRYYWDKHFLNAGPLKYLSYLGYIRDLKKHLVPGDVVYIYGLNDIKSRFAGIDGVKVYYEVTESPLVSLPGTNLYKPSLSEYLDDCRKMDGIIVISQKLKSYFIEQGIAAEKLSVINITVDSKRFEGVTKDSSSGRSIVYCGSVSNNKDGVDRLIKAFAAICKKHSDVHLCLLGKASSADVKNSNEELIRHLKIEDRVSMPGRVAFSDMPQWLVNATVLALDRPNNIQAEYGFPTKLGEYLLSGNPVVVTAVGDIPLFLKDKESALIANPDDNDEFAEKLDWALSHPEEGQMIGERGREIALSQFNYLTETKKLVEILKS